MGKRSIGNIQKLADGKYLLRFSAGFDDFGKRIQPSKVVYCKNDKEAEIELMNFRTEIDKKLKERLEVKPETLEQLYNEWMKNHVKANLAPKTISFYSDLWKKHLKNNSKIRLKSLTPRNIFVILDKVKGDRTTNAVFKMLKAMLNKAYQWGYVDCNPCDRVDTPKYKPKEKSYLKESDIERTMELIKSEELKYQVIFYFAVLCGLRRQEILGLMWSDIDFENNSFKVRRAVTYTKETGTIAKETKTDKSRRELHLPSVLNLNLVELKKKQDEQKEKLGDLWEGDDWILIQWNGKIMDIHTPSTWWNDFIKENQLPPITFHGLRHTAATYMIKNNVPVSTVSGVLGHANIGTTLNTYTHVIEDTKKSAINVMEDLFTPKKSNDDENM